MIGGWLLRSQQDWNAKPISITTYPRDVGEPLWCGMYRAGETQKGEVLYKFKSVIKLIKKSKNKIIETTRDTSNGKT